MTSIGDPWRVRPKFADTTNVTRGEMSVAVVDIAKFGARPRTTIVVTSVVLCTRTFKVLNLWRTTLEITNKKTQNTDTSMPK